MVSCAVQVTNHSTLTVKESACHMVSAGWFSRNRKKAKLRGLQKRVHTRPFSSRISCVFRGFRLFVRLGGISTDLAFRKGHFAPIPPEKYPGSVHVLTSYVNLGRLFYASASVVPNPHLLIVLCFLRVKSVRQVSLRSFLFISASVCAFGPTQLESRVVDTLCDRWFIQSADSILNKTFLCTTLLALDKQQSTTRWIQDANYMTSPMRYSWKQNAWLELHHLN